MLGPDDGDPYWWLGSLTLIKLSGGATRGGLDIIDHRVPPGYAPPPHVHRGQDEVWKTALTTKKDVGGSRVTARPARSSRVDVVLSRSCPEPVDVTLP